jgi:hypothetical protein
MIFLTQQRHDIVKGGESASSGEVGAPERIDLSPEALEGLPGLDSLGARPEIAEAADALLSGVEPLEVEPELVRLVLHTVFSITFG